MRRALFAPIIALPLVALLWFGLGRNPNTSVTPLINHQAPNFSLLALNGNRVSLSAFQGKPVVLNFWASWCTACKVEHPYLLDLTRKYRRRGVEFLAVSFQDTAGSARDWMREHGALGTDLQDPDQSTAIAYGVTGVPETFVIDRRGVLRLHSPGPVTPAGPVTPTIVERQLDTLLRSAA